MAVVVREMPWLETLLARNAKVMRDNFTPDDKTRYWKG
jgi:hypothetical protein